MSLRVKLSDIVEVLQTQAEEGCLLDRRTGVIVNEKVDDIPDHTRDDEELDGPDEDESPPEESHPEEGDGECGHLVELPTMTEVNELAMMRDFALAQLDETASCGLEKAVRRRWGYRYFREEVRRLGLDEEWREFRDEAYTDLAR
jgi:hypothetical protein